MTGAPAAPAIADDDVSLFFDRLGNPDDLGQWARTGDVLRFQVRLAGLGHDASLSMAAQPEQALTTVSCPADTTPATSQVAAPPVAPSADQAADQAADRARVCRIGDLSGERTVDVDLTVPQGATEVELAVTAEVRGDSGVATLRRSATMPVVTRVVEAPAVLSPYTITGTATLVDPQASTDTASPRDPVTSAHPRGAVPHAHEHQAREHTTHTLATSHHAVPAGPRTPITAPAPLSGLGSHHARPPQSSRGHAGAPAPAPRDARSGPADAQIPGIGGAMKTLELPQIDSGGQPPQEEGAPLPMQISVVAADRPEFAAQQFNVMTTANGFPVAAGGIGVLLAALWLVVRAQRSRIRRNVW
ncbi:hypothetical protein ACIBHX_21725 [Nonomuraea sp. NPDC050536]|uniref:hypothetical protein n=1 Tax=Nonomuraea sp. NPDC050536 TaxID=3364366 RepID=UPI0037C5DB9A